MTKSTKLPQKVKGLSGSIVIPGDKSISHRGVMFGSLANGTTEIKNFLTGEDCLSTIDCFRKMGVDITVTDDVVVVQGKGMDGLVEPSKILDVGNSGTTTRLMLGILAGSSFHSCIIGDDSIAKRPMNRVTAPLRMMGAEIDGRKEGGFTPLAVRGTKLQAIDYVSPVASAQVKSAVLLAGLNANGTTSVTEPAKSRDHTERMLRAFGCEVEESGLRVSIKGGQTLSATKIVVPGDISSAAFFLVAGAITPNSSITLKDVGMNPTRTGIIDILTGMGADLIVENERTVNFEPVADLTISTSDLKGIEISGEIIPRLIDEIPVIALLASQASGQTVIKDASELKVKETNRIDTVVNELSKLGVNIQSTDDGMVITGSATPLSGGQVSSYGDHRIGMMLAVASLIADGDLTLDDPDAIAVSYPTFFEHLKELSL
ncbi:3-phosphoshikimate 1-carboxyvinyltransferase [Litchfieldia alkalitelluris]|uniref:3-phosphoshikimate 1-carboxyvinyltransferase n=1 Tax=Litchfieldia alkalitelluris TaxID=304268 RepID=UPI0009962BC9|nr:3-phosphoshikimate 1-carboxyvinyltransferase [Litchfieldia alkalitelluris]